MTAYSLASFGSACAAAPQNAQRRSPVELLALALEVSKERRALSSATPEQLADMGLSPEQARIEAARPIWDLPKAR